MDTTDHAPTQFASRRRFLAAGAAGAAVSAALPVLGRHALASSTPGAVPGARPTPADIELLRLGQLAEASARDLYRIAADGATDPRVGAVMAAMVDHHRAYTEAFSALLGPEGASGRAEAVYAEYAGDFGNPDRAPLAAAALEDALVATHTQLVGSLEETEGAELVASILVVEARHATVLKVLGNVSDLDGLVSTIAGPIDFALENS